MVQLCYPTLYDALAAQGVTVSVVERDSDTWEVRVQSTIHVRKDYILSIGHSKEFTPEQVLRSSEVMDKLAQSYGIRFCSGYTSH